jgi:hypothetical protein
MNAGGDADRSSRRAQNPWSYYYDSVCLVCSGLDKNRHNGTDSHVEVVISPRLGRFPFFFPHLRSFPASFDSLSRTHRIVQKRKEK